MASIENDQEMEEQAELLEQILQSTEEQGEFREQEEQMAQLEPEEQTVQSEHEPEPELEPELQPAPEPEPESVMAEEVEITELLAMAEEAALVEESNMIGFSDHGDFIETLVSPEQPDKSLPKASPEAIKFLASIRMESYNLLQFPDSLVTITYTGKEVGEYNVTLKQVLFRGERGFYIQASSHGTIDGVPCGTSITGYITKQLETLRQQNHEYIKVKDLPLDKKTLFKKQGNNFVVQRTVTEGEEVKNTQKVYKCEDMEGLISESANLLLLRLLNKQKIFPENMNCLALDTELQLSLCTYTHLGSKMMSIGSDKLEVYGIQRTIHSEDDLPLCWQSYFLMDGHLANRIQVGSPVVMVLLNNISIVKKEEHELKPTFLKKLLNLEEDMQLYSHFLDKTEELKADHSSYISHHPELRALIADFLQFLLLRKPEDVVTFAAEYFTSFSSRGIEENIYLSSQKSSPFRKKISTLGSEIVLP